MLEKNVSILDFERLDYDLWKNIATKQGESVLVRHAFRWSRNGEFVPNAYESRDLESICEERNWKIVERYGDHIAIVIHNPVSLN